MPKTAAPPSPKTAPSLPDGIEIFRAGTHIDDAGVSHQFSAADIADMAASYNPAVREAPLTVGHPKDNLPAYGWVKAVNVTPAGVLTINAHQVEPQFAEMVQTGLFKKRSASFYPPSSPNNPTPGRWYLRHVAFLGAQPPAVAGLKDISFSSTDTDTGAVSFSESVAPPPTSPENQVDIEELKAQLKAAQDAEAAAKAEATAAKAQAASFAEAAKKQRTAGFASFAEAQVQAGKLLPKDKDMAVATLDALADVQPVQFAEGNTTKTVSHVQWLQDLIAGATPAISFGEFAGGKPPAASTQGSAQGKSDAEIDAAAHAYARQHKVDYAEALAAVTATSFTTT